MPIMQYKSGVVAPDGGEEWLSEYICDWEGCRLSGEYDGLCEKHFEESGAAEEHRQEAARQREEEDHF